MTITDPAIESPKRTALIIAIANQIGFPLDELNELIYDALEHEPIHPYAASPDLAESPRITMIAMLEALIGYDDDHDDARHDLDHALDTIDYCDDHPTNCSICCDLHD
jgi:hypothetical protein